MSDYYEDDGLDFVSYTSIPVDTHAPEPAWEKEVNGISLYAGPAEDIAPDFVSMMEAWEHGQDTYYCGNCGSHVPVSDYQQHAANCYSKPRIIDRVINFFRKK